jgi:hypothetical protein
MKTVIPEVLTRFAVRPVDPTPERQRVQHVTLSPSAGARVIAEARG